MSKNKTLSDIYTEIVKINYKLEEQKEEFVTRQEFNEKHDLVMTTLDKVLGETIAMRQEQTINSQRFDDTDKEIGGLNKRVKKLEDNQPTQQF